MPRALIKILLVIGLMLLAYLLLAGCDWLGWKHSEKKSHVKQWLLKQMNRISGFKLRVEGEPVHGKALIVSNHLGYFDVSMFYEIVGGDVCFTPKSEVRGWPFIGSIVDRFDVVFVNRSPGKTKETTEQLVGALEEGRRICVFPEASTGDGRTMLPFRSSLFSIAELWKGQEPLPVQPVTVLYERVDGKPIDDSLWPHVAWYGDSTFFGHLWRFLQFQEVEARLFFHPPTTLQEGETRKELASRCQAIVAASLPSSALPPA